MSLSEQQKQNVEYLMEKLGFMLLGGTGKKAEGYDKFKTSFEDDTMV